MDIEKLKARTPRYVFERWKAYYQFEPFGDDWDQAATIAAAAMNPHVKKKAKIADLKPRYRIRRQNPETIQAHLAAAFGVKHGRE